jgi:hypothetical protein
MGKLATAIRDRVVRRLGLELGARSVNLLEIRSLHYQKSVG